MSTTGRSYRTEQDEPVRTWRVRLARALDDSDRRTLTVDALTPEVAAKWATLHAATDEHTSLLAWSVVRVTELERTDEEEVTR